MRLLLACTAKATVPALALLKLVNHFKADLRNGYDDHLRNAIHGLNNEWLVATVP